MSHQSHMMDVEKKAEEAGKSIEEFTKDKYEKMELALSDISHKIKKGTYKAGDGIKEGAPQLFEDLKEIHLKVRAKRHELTGGRVEYAAIAALKSIEDKLDKLVEKMKK